MEFRSTATFNVSSNTDATAVALDHELRRRFADMKPAYSLLARMSILFTILFAWGAVGIVFTCLKMVGLKPWGPQGNLSALDELNAVVVFALLLTGVLYPLDLLRAWLFPRLFFLVGRQQDSFELRKKWRWFVLTALVVSPAVKIILDRVTR